MDAEPIDNHIIIDVFDGFSHVKAYFKLIFTLSLALLLNNFL